MKRLIDIVLVVLASLVLFVLILIVAILVKLSSPGPILYWSDRVGKRNVIFKMPKFRTMQINAPVIATHLLKNPEMYMTPVGAFLRKTSLDELPQLWSILTGNMSFVGPRPALFNQYDLIEHRTKFGIDSLSPGLTGLAQINGRDELTIPEKVKFDLEYLQKKSVTVDLFILYQTVLKVIKRDGVQH